MAEQNGAQSVYVVQAAMSEKGVWIDAATVKAAARTRRRTILQRAHEQGLLPPLEAGTVVRVLDRESAREIPLELEQPPARLKIG